MVQKHLKDVQGAMNYSIAQSLTPHDGDHNEPAVHVKSGDTVMEPTKVSKLACINLPPPPLQREDFVSFPDERTVLDVLEEEDITNPIDGTKAQAYRVKMGAGHIEIVSYEDLLKLTNGRNLYDLFQQRQSADTTSYEGTEADNSDIVLVSSRSSKERRRLSPGPALSMTADGESSEDELSTISLARLQRITRQTTLALTRSRPNTRNSALKFAKSDTGDTSEESSSSRTKFGNRRSTRSSMQRVTRSSKQDQDIAFAGMTSNDSVDSSAVEGELPLLRSDVVFGKRKRKRASSSKTTHLGITSQVTRSEKAQPHGTRHSERSTRHQRNMQETSLQDVYRSESEGARAPPKATGAREAFQALPRGNRFHLRHCQQCDTCGNYGSGPHGQLIHCQGCTLSYHKTCLGNRGSREHLVTKVGDGNFVLQCRRCVNIAKKKELTAPNQAICQTCREVGNACHPFRERKTPLQEEREREMNDGIDPIVKVDAHRLNNANNVLFRCTKCWRAFHFHHLLPRSDLMDTGEDDESVAEQRLREYGRDWQCRDCISMPAKVSGLVAWRPIDPENYVQGFTVKDVNEDEKEYLVKWEGLSYFQAQWMPGAWTWGVTASAMRIAFAKRKDGKNLPTMSTEDAIPEDYLRIDIVLDVRFTSIVDTRGEAIDKARIREVDRALIKYKGLGYEDAVWEKVPGPDDGDRWTDFVTAYNDWVMGRYVKIPKSVPLKIRLEKARCNDFNVLEKKKQPDMLVGGELMKYQLDGLNWLYYRWYIRQNGILADEMGLGKTIQIIGLLATLVQDHNCFPFLVVVPNSTCTNWRREIKQWTPSLRVVTYFGSSAARSMAYQHELYPEGSKDLRCHVVITSYEAAADDSCRRFFKSVPWQGLIVDEGQRLKSDKNMIYTSLSTLKVPFRILLTGTPMQNNARELFNLLQFLDDSFDAAALELEYAELTKDNIPHLHDLIRPFFLRRTKAQVLTFLPAMAQVIVPVSMSVVQKKLYVSILAKNPELVRAIFDLNRTIKQGERANLSNILMQLRKCLCHPFVYNEDIEERSVTAAVSHRNLVDASGKLQLLEILLPKLKERGHRVLIFSQFLSMLDIVEDFCDGLDLRYQRLDGTINSLQKQKRIDEFNAPESPLFAFLLSTRAGGVGVNLATADTVIILDPDFNPHQDIQALSRAHRIGQKKKVLCFQLMTAASAEEKIVRIGRKKMALDHILIEQMDAEEEDVVDVESILRYGAAEILDGDAKDIRYDDTSVEKLLDRSQVEDTKTGEDKTAESQFSFARVWANDAASLSDNFQSSVIEEKAPDPTVWDRILRDRERLAAAEAAARQQALGRGKRTRQTVNYSTTNEQHVESPENRRNQRHDSDSDTDFQAQESAGEDSVAEEPSAQDIGAEELQAVQAYDRARIFGQPREPQVNRAFRRSTVIWPTNPPQLSGHVSTTQQGQENIVVRCMACGTVHHRGYCPLKLAGEEYCNLCGLAHYGHSRTCPHIQSETQVGEMLAAIKQSPEPSHLKELAKKYLKGVKGDIVRSKKMRMEKMNAAALEATAKGDGSVTQVLSQPPKETASRVTS